MAFDGIVTRAVVCEFQKTILGGKINRVNEPEKDEIVLQIYSGQKNFRVLLSANPENARACLTDINRENPMSAPSFCMVLRKHLVGSSISYIEQTDFDRIITFGIEGINDLGDPFSEKLIVEIMGRRSNIVLVNASGVIIDAIKHVDSDINSYREILPARVYVAPPAQTKKLPGAALDFSAVSDDKADKFIMDNIMGFSKPLCRAIVNDGRTKFAENLYTVYKTIEESAYKPFIFADYSDFHVIPLVKNISEAPEIRFSSVSAALEEFYREREIRGRAKNLKADYEKIVAQNIERVERKIKIYAEDIESVSDYDLFRIKGDLLAANMHLLKGGESEIILANFYDENMAEIQIELTPHRSPAWNLQNYYKLYRKGKSKTENCLENTVKAENELKYLLSVKESLEKAVNQQDIEQIKEELVQEGYIKKKKENNKKRPPSVKTDGYLELKTSDGTVVWVGKNNIQNDKLTLKLAAANDIWFHVKNAPGSHVILRVSENGGAYTETEIVEAAKIAALHSSLSESHRADVDFTRAKFVKKPSGAKPGMVIYVNQKTITIDF